ncbi:universal stress protein [Pontibacter qinzhouensis]|uniref:Universal stress protein n=1 Tax=Pontibacter qinzhouensis TaxID=2603253 RepID=A0A5C8JKL0_9BACT|nr:universal stress protein [Pontibacter qinzhouensis]TXK37576.1 universal stress protein [Pontibacter qinzhouensis]
MFKILVPIDFSDSTDAACQYALNLTAGVPDAQLLLLHCFQDYLADGDPVLPSATDLTPSEIITEQVLHRNEIDAQQQLDELYHQVAEEARRSGSKVKIERTFISGFPEDEILEQARRFKPSLVIMGTKGQKDFSRSLFGTITTKVLGDLKVPLLTVPQEYAAGPIRKVLYATDFDKADVAAIEAVLELLQPFQASTYCVHISTDDQEHDREKLLALQEQLRQNASSTHIQFSLLEGGEVAKTLQEFVHQESINLIALTNRERNLLDEILHPSLAKKLVLTAAVPLLIFHSKK